MAGSEGARAASRRVGGFESAGEVARRALRLDPAERVHGSKLHAPAGSSDFRKNLSRARAATAEAGAAFEDFRRTQLDVLSRARAAFHRLANEYAQLEVNQRNVDLLNQFAEVNRQRYEVGNATQADVLTAQTDAAKLLEAQSDIFRRISDAQSQLNVLMNRPAQSPLAQPSQIPFQSPHLSLQALQAVALSARPEMQRAQNRVEAERFRVELANRQWFSD